MTDDIQVWQEIGSAIAKVGSFLVSIEGILAVVGAAYVSLIISLIRARP
jgi:hypothetical protein